MTIDRPFVQARAAVARRAVSHPPGVQRAHPGREERAAIFDDTDHTHAVHPSTVPGAADSGDAVPRPRPRLAQPPASPATPTQRTAWQWASGIRGSVDLCPLSVPAQGVTSAAAPTTGLDARVVHHVDPVDTGDPGDPSGPLLTGPGAGVDRYGAPTWVPAAPQPLLLVLSGRVTKELLAWETRLDNAVLERVSAVQTTGVIELDGMGRALLIHVVLLNQRQDRRVHLVDPSPAVTDALTLLGAKDLFVLD